MKTNVGAWLLLGLLGLVGCSAAETSDKPGKAAVAPARDQPDDTPDDTEDAAAAGEEAEEKAPAAADGEPEAAGGPDADPDVVTTPAPLEGPLPLPEIAGLGPDTTEAAFIARFKHLDDPPREDSATFAYRKVPGATYESPLIDATFYAGTLQRVRLGYHPKHPPKELGIEGPWIDLLGKQPDGVAAVLGQPHRAHDRPVEEGETPLTNEKMLLNRHVSWTFEDLKTRAGEPIVVWAELYFEKSGGKNRATSVNLSWTRPAAAKPKARTLAAVKIPKPVKKRAAPKEFRGAAVKLAKSNKASVERAAGGVGINVAYPTFVMANPGRTQSTNKLVREGRMEEADSLEGAGETGTFEFSCTAGATTEFLVSYRCYGLDDRMLDRDLALNTGGAGNPEQWAETLIVSSQSPDTMVRYDVTEAFKDHSLEDLMWIAAAVTAQEEGLEDADVELAIRTLGDDPFSDGTGLALFDGSGLAFLVCEVPGADDCLELSLPWAYAAALADPSGPVAALRALYED